MTQTRKSRDFLTINKPIRVSRKTATAIDHILTNSFCDTVFKTAIYKCDVSDHFPICFIIPSPSKQENVTETTFITKRILNTKSIEFFKQKLYEASWDEMEMSQNPDQAYKTFLTKFSDLYNIYFPTKIIKVKNKDLNSPWITKGIKKSSKRKQRLYEKFLKNRTEKPELAYKTYKRLFESIKKHSKKLHLSNPILKYKNNIKKPWEVIKESIGKRNCHDQNFPKKIVVDGKDITDEELIAKCFDKYFAEIGPKLAKNIQKSSINFESFMKTCDSTQAESALTINELKDAFFSLQINKSPGYDKISFNVVRNCFGPLLKPLMFIFNLSLQKGSFPDKLKIAKVTPVFKADDVNELWNYRPISVLPCFYKIQERIMYNRLFKYLKTNEILYKKQFGFQEGHSTEHAIIQLIDQINNCFEKNHFTLGISIDLKKAFDNVDHAILIKKLKHYGIKGNNLRWFESYLENRKQYITYETNKFTAFENMTCDVPQGSILGPLPFLLYINDLPNVSNILDPIMFADDTNLFYSHHNIKELFTTVNKELQKLGDWFTSNKLSLNINKTKCTFFHKNSVKGSIPLKLPDLHISNKTIERTSSIKFLGVMLDEHITWNEHIKTIGKKLAKNIGLLYKARVLLDKELLKTIYIII